jgi:hypothetical protein
VQNTVKALVISSAVLAKGLNGIANSFDDDSQSAAKIKKWADKIEKRKERIAKLSTTKIDVCTC